MILLKEFKESSRRHRHGGTVRKYGGMAIFHK